MQESGKVGHVILIGSLVRYDIYVSQGRKKHAAIGYVSLNEIDVGGNIVWPAVRMDSVLEVIDDADLIAPLEE